ncbi:glycerophosphoryl diester phosphodiesterase [Pedobacter africanus]|uniref:Glycerophosphoryl diester phosphodiesterase n=1 Tax=Pedobacter africanus TaxID=151894 RepID=A0ACC6KWH2_9SPHI|nr:glycerophosphodiester phosphodiesterase family protein [Pedobacter africanus]MDR6783566.1 glycerophosphoryl diester phosphodiesterase [Pedobacter africanus]
MKHSPLVIVLMAVALNGAFAQKKAKTIKTWNKNVVIAHRGAWKKQSLPENSIASLKEAIRLGCHGSEFDVHMTKDNVLVVNHDADFQGLHIEQSTYAELLEKKLSNGEPIPTAEAYIKEGIKQKGTRLVFEIKPTKKGAAGDIALTEACVNLVKKLKAEAWVDYISFSWDTMIKLAEMAPDAHIAYLKGDKSLEELKAAKMSGADYHYSVYQKGEWFRKAKELGLTINAWTVNNEAEMTWLLDNKVEFITTNEPELLFETIKKHK